MFELPIAIVEDLRGHSTETVEELERLLATKAPLRPEPTRPNFYEVDGGDRVFYIYVATGKVWLLATWRHENGGLRPAQRVA
jgi:hypothetical protein